ncbi:hypothetical protein FH972_027200 [Carpinus fangiana]|uniref:Uncharacterized protein n=1 Tax=Carpinus fangiana TaxID=176857 RepID=A0A5N6L718_9ROSI|nr:hypothetical protein FH972_027200 [Carpinus fangiana]
MTTPVKDVWASDLDSAFSEIEEAILGCHRCCMAMDIEFPGSLCGYSRELPRELKQFSNYELLKMNVDSTHLIQLGLSFCEVIENGEFGNESSWQFTFKEFKEEDHSHNTTYVAFLKEPGDNLLVKNQLDGIKSNEFEKKLMESSLLSNPKLNGLTFHGNLDISYLIKMLSIRRVLPLKVNEFKGMMNSIFCGGMIGYLVNGLSDFPIKTLK